MTHNICSSAFMFFISSEKLNMRVIRSSDQWYDYAGDLRMQIPIMAKTCVFICTV